MRIEDIPVDVMWVSFIKMSGVAVGIETYSKVKTIIEKYPEWFPQETIYNSIPQEVKELFEKEKSELNDSFYPRKEWDITPGEGLVAWVNRQPVDTTIMAEKSLSEALNYIFTEKPAKEKQYKTALKSLHNKHYKKYKYKFE